MLKEALTSIIKQTFADFEVIVGNDYVQERLSPEMIGINDPRIRFINHLQNLGEMRNMNYLLNESRGCYFTWLADDDLYASDFLETVYTTLIKGDFPSCAFTSFQMGRTYQAMDITTNRSYNSFTGKEFLQKYLSRSLRTQGCYGIFNRQYINDIGGIEQLGNGFSPYSDILLVIRAGLLEKVIYIDTPLILFRAHEGSISLTSKNLSAYISAQVDLCHKTLPILKNETLMEDFDLNHFLLIKWCMEDIVCVAFRSDYMGGKEMTNHLLFLMRHIQKLGRCDLYIKSLLSLSKMLIKCVIRLWWQQNSKSERSAPN